MKQLWTFAALLLLVGCGTSGRRNRQSPLEGIWTLTQVTFPAGERMDYPIDNRTLIRVYEGDSVMHQCAMTKTTSGMVIHDMGEPCNITLIDKGGGEHHYQENRDLCPLTLLGDTAIVVQRYGVRYTWLRADAIDREWGTEIRKIIDEELRVTSSEENSRASERMSRYVLSAEVRQQGRIIHRFIYATIAGIILLAASLRMAVNNRKERKRLQLQIQQIREEHERRPQPVKNAIAEVEREYFSSEGYLSLQRRIARGMRLDEADWNEIGEQVKKVYPSFISRLQNLHAMSELEQQVCLLIKLRIPPSDIAAVLFRDVSTISTVRSRLYKKVFGQKGGARDWDEFILSINA